MSHYGSLYRNNYRSIDTKGRAGWRGRGECLFIGGTRQDDAREREGSFSLSPRALFSRIVLPFLHVFLFLPLSFSLESFSLRSICTAKETRAQEKDRESREQRT